ncbi:MAG: T9SS C-terminal target domain-containing protein, partial [Aquificota bacterium]
TYNLRMTNRVSLTIYNSLGEKVRTLVNRQQSPGRYEVVWDGRDDSGQLVTSGVYLYKLEAGKFNQAKKMILVR